MEKSIQESESMDLSSAFLKKPDMSAYDLAKYTYPIWEGNVCFGETAFVREQEDGSIAPIQLLYNIEKIFTVRSADLKTLYYEGEDYRIANGKLEIIKGGRIKIMPYSTYCYTGAPKKGDVEAKDGFNYYWNDMMYNKTANDGGIVEYDISVTYRHNTDTLPINIPVFDRRKLISFRKKVLEGQNVVVTSLGDSITFGCSASANKPEGAWGAAAPGYSKMVCDYIAKAYKLKLTHNNLAVSGMSSDWGLTQINAVCNTNPDLVILAFGANDAVYGERSAHEDSKKFASNIRKIVDGIHKGNPDTQIVVVTTCRCNQKWILSHRCEFSTDIIDEFHDDEYVTVADVTKLDKELTGELQDNGRKSYQDITGSNTNHPNDYMHRLYAQVVIRAIFGEYKL